MLLIFTIRRGVYPLIRSVVQERMRIKLAGKIHLYTREMKENSSQEQE